MNRTITTTLTLCALALAAGCGDAFDVTPTAPEIAGDTETASWSASQGDVIERMAKSMAEALADPRFRESLYEEAAEKFTGDTEALYSRLASKQVAGTTWDRALDVEARPHHTERLHFYVYGIEYSNPGEAPLVAVGVEDEDAAVLRAFDPDGNEHELDAQIPPTQTVVVVGLNERIDENGRVREGLVDISRLTQVAADGPGGGGGGGRGGGGGGTGGQRVSPHAETIERIYLIDDNEPWPRGAPEIMMQMSVLKYPSAPWKGSFPDVDDEHRWYNVDHFLFYWYRDPPDNDYGFVAAILWYESDGGFPLKEIELEVPFGGENGGSTTFVFEIEDGDDEMGSAIINFADPLDTVYNTGDIKWEHN